MDSEVFRQKEIRFLRPDPRCHRAPFAKRPATASPLIAGSSRETAAGAHEQLPEADLPGKGGRPTRSTISSSSSIARATEGAARGCDSRQAPIESIGAPDTTMPCARCDIRKYCSDLTVWMACSHSTWPSTAANDQALGRHGPRPAGGSGRRRSPRTAIRGDVPGAVRLLTRRLVHDSLHRVLLSVRVQAARDGAGVSKLRPRWEGRASAATGARSPRRDRVRPEEREHRAATAVMGLRALGGGEQPTREEPRDERNRELQRQADQEHGRRDEDRNAAAVHDPLDMLLGDERHNADDGKTRAGGASRLGPNPARASPRARSRSTWGACARYSWNGPPEST